jgi:transketolase
MPNRSVLADALRVLAMDAVQQANSGHPGMPMGMAEIAEVLWNDHLRHNPANPKWPNRDRFVLSNGHGSMLLYGLLHLSGYELPIDELKNFRQLNSMTPGHPEFGLTPGVETTTGPLGQGLANAVGMALAEKLLAANFNRGHHTIVDHVTYCFAGDGCLMEGISHEACSLAGTLGLGKLIVFYDDNGISIDGPTSGWFTDDTPARFRAYGWQVIPAVDGHDAAAIDAAVRSAKADTARPTLICCRTVIGKGSPNRAGTAKAHGAPLGKEEVAATRQALGWKASAFELGADVYAAWDAKARGAALEQAWNQAVVDYAKDFPDLAGEFHRRLMGEPPEDYAVKAVMFALKTMEKAETIASRKASSNAIAAFAQAFPELIGGSADLTESNLTLWPDAKVISANGAGNYLFYGVREFAMCAIANGIALHGSFLPFVATFLVFSDYCRNAIRMAALMHQRVVYVFTHDSIGLGEDGPTHQPIEHLASLRYIPQLDVWRPCDAVETAAAWIAAVERRFGPTALVLSRQNLPHQARDEDKTGLMGLGGYVLTDPPNRTPEVVIIGTGSEVQLAVQAQTKLASDGIAVRVVSMPCCEMFDRQDRSYRDTVLPPGIPRVAVEAGVTDYWRKYVGLDGEVVGIDKFGASAPAADLFRKFGITVEFVTAAARSVVKARRAASAAPPAV